MTKKYFVCDKCSDPIETTEEFLLQWRHDCGINRSYDCKIIHEKCSDSLLNSIITCERTFSELRTKTLILAWLDTIAKLALQEHKSFLTCLKRLLNNGDIKI